MKYNRIKYLKELKNYNNKMDLILSIIVFMVLTISTSPLNASPFEFNHDGRFSCLDKSSCSCTTFVNDYEIMCPPDDPSITVKVRPGNNVQIDCSRMNENVYLELPNITLGDMQFVQFGRCPLPAGGSSIQTVLNRLGIRKTRTLDFRSYGAGLGGTLVRQHLSGFNDLERLMLSGNGLSDLPDDLFNDLHNLTWLNLRSNKVHLPVNILQNLKRLEYIELGYNNLQSLEPGLFRNQHRLKDLNLWGNNLQNLTKDAFYGATSTQELDLSSNNMEYIDEDVFTYLTNMSNINLSANRFKTLPSGLFRHNQNLTRLRLMNNRIPIDTLPDLFLANLPILEDVTVAGCDLANVSANLFYGSPKIRTLSFTSNRLTTLPEMLLSNQTNLQHLDLSKNQLIELNDNLFKDTVSLEILRLSDNRITTISGLIFRNLLNLQELHVDNNQLQTIHAEAFVGCGDQLHNLQLQNNQLSFVNINDDIMSFNDKTGSVFQYLKEIRIINLRNNSIMNILTDWNYNNFRLQELDLSYNNISYLSYTDLNFFSDDIIVNLTNNGIQEINFKEVLLVQNISEKVKNIKVYLDRNPLRCDCLIMYFIQYLQQEITPAEITPQIIVDNMQCAEPAEMADRPVRSVHPMELLCLLDSPKSTIKHCPDQCECKVRTADRAMILNCSNANLTTVPKLPNPAEIGLDYTELYIENNSIRALPSIRTEPAYRYVSKLFAVHNQINHLLSENVPDNLTILEIGNNQLKWINSSILHGGPSRNQLTRLVLGHNPLVCDCHAKEFLAYTQNHYKIIADRKNIRCPDGRHFNELRVGDLCPENEIIIIVASVVVAVLGLLIGILAALYYKYQQEVKVWMYAHNLCMWFVTEEELDREKKYDAFISYSHKDVDFLTEHLVPYLENSPHQFKLCLHDRDWLVGAFIQDSIAQSVEDSRRTIVILSPNFLESIWAKMEFQVAHKNAITEGRARVIVVIYGDIGDVEKLDPALKSYLKTNTYVKWGDPWFWKKLSYAMPHSNVYRGKKSIKNGGVRGTVDDKLELIKPIPVTPPLTTPPAELAAQKFLHNGGINGHVNGAFIINTNAKQSDV